MVQALGCCPSKAWWSYQSLSPYIGGGGGVVGREENSEGLFITDGTALGPVFCNMIIV